MSHQQGASPVASVLSLAVVLGFLLIATQLLVHLHAVNAVTAVVADEARQASASPERCAGVVVRVRARLGTWGREAEVGCRFGTARLQVHVAGDSPGRFLAVTGTRIERRVALELEPAP